MAWDTYVGVCLLFALMELIPGVSAQTNSNSMALWIIMATVGVCILIICIVLFYCFVCRNSPKGDHPESSRGSLSLKRPNGTPSGSGMDTPPVPPGVWTTTNNPNMFAGKPNDLYKYANGKGPPRHPYSNGAPANRPYTSNPDLVEHQNKPDIVSRRVSHTDLLFTRLLVDAHVINAMQHKAANKTRPAPQVANQPKLLKRDSKKAPKVRGDESKGMTLQEEEQVSGSVNKIRVNGGGQPTARIYVNYDSPPPSYSSDKKVQDPYIAKVYSDYAESKDVAGNNVSRVYSHGDDYHSASLFVAQAMVRSHESALNSAGVGPHATHVHLPHSDWNVAGGSGKATPSVKRTQSNVEKSQNSKPKKPFFGKSKAAKNAEKDRPKSQGAEQQISNKPAYASGPYGRGVVINRSPSDATAYQRRRENSAERKEKNRRLGLVTGPGAQLTRPERPLSQQIPTGGPSAASVQRSASDASKLRAGYPPSEELYAVPNKLRQRDSSPPRPRQRPPSTPTSPEPPPLPPHPAPEEDPPRTRNISDALSTTTSEGGSIGKAGVRITTSAFQFLDSYPQDDVSVSSHALDVSFADLQVNNMFNFLDTYSLTSHGMDEIIEEEKEETREEEELKEEKHEEEDKSHIYMSASSTSLETVVEAPDKIASQAFSFLDEFEDEDLRL